MSKQSRDYYKRGAFPAANNSLVNNAWSHINHNTSVYLASPRSFLLFFSSISHPHFFPTIAIWTLPPHHHHTFQLFLLSPDSYSAVWISDDHLGMIVSYCKPNSACKNQTFLLCSRAHLCMCEHCRPHTHNRAATLLNPCWAITSHGSLN